MTVEEYYSLKEGEMVYFNNPTTGSLNLFVKSTTFYPFYHTFIELKANRILEYMIDNRYIERADPPSKVPLKDPRFPHTCYNCKGPAYIGAVPAAFECKAKCR